MKKIKLAWPGVELRDRSGRPDPLALDSDDRSGGCVATARPIAFTGSSGSGAPQGGGASAGVRRPISMAKPKTHITDPTKDAPEGAAWTLCGLFVPARAGGHRRSVVPEMPPGRPTKELKSRDKGPLTRPGSARDRSAQSRSAMPLVSPFRPLRGSSADFPGLDLGIPRAYPSATRPQITYFPQACVILGIFPRAFGIPLDARNAGIRDTPPPLKYGHSGYPFK